MNGIRCGGKVLSGTSAARAVSDRDDGNLFPTDPMPEPEPTSESLGPLWEKVRPELSQLVRLLGIDTGQAEDILQDVYITAWKKSPPGLDADQWRRWVFRVTANRCRLEQRRQGRRRRLLEGLVRMLPRSQPGRAETPPDERSEEREAVRQALDALDPATRSLLVLRYFAEFDSREIGELLDLPDATVRGRLRTAREKLAKRLRQSGYGHE
jgi:RNA polymerase sigma-70 factor, ECF subfamily